MVDQPFEGEVVLEVARRWLNRNDDPFTRRHRDDLAQEAAATTWRVWHTLRDPQCTTAFVRTIVKRLRYHALHRHFHGNDRNVPMDPTVLDRMAHDEQDAAPTYRVGNRLVEAEWLKRELDLALARLDATARDLLNAYYAGSSCREIGGRYGLSEGCVKQRLFRARSRVREAIESRARGAGTVRVVRKDQEQEREADR